MLLRSTYPEEERAVGFDLCEDALIQQQFCQHQWSFVFDVKALCFTNNVFLILSSTHLILCLTVLKHTELIVLYIHVYILQLQTILWKIFSFLTIHLFYLTYNWHNFICVILYFIAIISSIFNLKFYYTLWTRLLKWTKIQSGINCQITNYETALSLLKYD